MARHPQVAKYIDMPLQHAHPDMLKRMKRPNDMQRTRRIIGSLREAMPDIAIRTTFIVGFPGETEKTVRETIDFIRENEPDYYRAQMWYCEPGTPIQQHRDKYDIKGEGFVWSHATMDSLSAMDQIDQMFLSVRESIWLPQWSFDFWIIPYLLGRGISAANLRDFMESANKLLALEIACLPGDQKRGLQQQHLQAMLTMAGQWQLDA